MNLLIAAGVETLKPIEAATAREQALLIQDMRKSLVDAFLSIINGIKSPQLESHGRGQTIDNNQKDVNAHIQNMFWYLDSLMQKDDLDTTNADLAR